MPVGCLRVCVICSLTSYMYNLTSLTSSRSIYAKWFCYELHIHLTALTLGVIYFNLMFFFSVFSAWPTQSPALVQTMFFVITNVNCHLWVVLISCDGFKPLSHYIVLDSLIKTFWHHKRAMDMVSNQSSFNEWKITVTNE